MSTCHRILTVIVIAFLFGAPEMSAAQEEREPQPHDMAYTSPTWGYQVRWDSDVWTVDRETSAGGLDSLWLSDAAGNVAGFDGAPGFDGDAGVCLDQLLADVTATPGIADIAIVSDEAGTVQSARDPWWSWVILLARLPGDGQPIDHVIYLDCRPLVPGSAVLARRLAGPAATFEANTNHFNIVDAALPRSAWEVNTEYGGLEPVGIPSVTWPLFYDQVCGGYPRRPSLAYDMAGNERATLTAVDGTPEYSAQRVDPTDAIRVILIENSGDTPLTIGPTNFVFVEPEIEAETRLDIAPAVVTWEDTGDAEARELGSGESATVHITWPDGVPFPDEGFGQGVFLVFRDPALSEDVRVDSIGVPGGCGGGSRPRLRLRR